MPRDEIAYFYYLSREKIENHKAALRSLGKFRFFPLACIFCAYLPLRYYFEIE